jgi:ATP-dependent Clp protease ATP-binding subunit ClpC
MTEGSGLEISLGAKRLIESAQQKMHEGKHSFLGLHHWLLAMLEKHAPMAESMVRNIDIENTRKLLLARISQGDFGTALEESAVIQKSSERAKQRGKAQVSERDIVFILLQLAGYTIQDADGMTIPVIEKEEIPGEINQTPSPLKDAIPLENEKESSSNTPTLEQFGRDLTQEARNGKIRPLVGREEEIQLMIETLCRTSKRNPVLIGPAGVGKTAIVEGLAQYVISGKVPEFLKNSRIIALQPSTLVAGAHYAGELDKRMQAILKEATSEGILLFIDEIHTIMGTGGMMGTSDIGSMLKPALARGDIACIAATTDDEYRKFIETDTALERRFQPIRVHELNPDQTFVVLQSVREVLATKRNITMDDGILRWLIQFGDQNMRNRHFPDKAVDLLEQCVAHSIAIGKNTVEMSDAQEVGQRMVGMPLSLEKRLDNLKNHLEQQGILSSDEIQIVINRLQVTMRGLDLRSGRPNVVLLLSGDAANNSDVLAETLSKELFGSTDRVITIDFSRFTHPADISLLVGAPPGYVGYSDSLPLHRIAQIPWCILRFENIDQCVSSIRSFISQGLETGMIVDGRGRPLYFSDTVVILTADISISVQHGLGFKTDSVQIKSEDVFKAVVECVGQEVAEQIDLFVPGLAKSGGLTQKWLKEHLLKDLTDRYLSQGVELLWDQTTIAWLSKQQEAYLSERDWEHWVDEALSPALIPYLPKTGKGSAVAVRVKMNENQVVIEPIEQEKRNGIQNQTSGRDI